MTNTTANEAILAHFSRQDAAHLPHEQAAIIQGRFFDMACSLTALLPAGAERTVALLKLLEARDCAYRAVAAQ